MSFMPAFDRFPVEGAIIGKMVVGYGELEMDWLTCLEAVFGNFKTAARVMYRLRTEANRFDVGDAVLKPYYEKLDMSADYDQAYGVFNRCKKIRNNHAHCHWADSAGNLFYTIFEDAVKSRGDDSSLSFFHVDLKLLQKQLDLFEHCQDHLMYLRYEARARTHKQTQALYLKPKTMQLVPLHNPIDSSPSFLQGLPLIAPA